nr:ribonuclease H-like domain-containing protein [Tanacetum cinerariifolium]
MTHPHPKRNFVPTTVATKSRKVLVNVTKQNLAASTSTARLKVNTAAIRPNVNAKSSYFKPHFHKRRHFNQRSAAKTNTFLRKINTAKGKNVTTARPKAIANVAEGMKENAVKSSTCWIWRPKDQWIFNSGCSRHMTGNKSFLTEYQEIDGGFVAFGGSPKRGKITGKGKIRTGKLDFEDVYFVKELKFNLFFVSQMRDKKNSVLFTETKCLVLSPGFKLLDESQVLLKVPRQNNMYSFDLKNVVPLGDLTCLFAKAIIDESNLWHRRLGHINFKTLNKLVRGNLVRGCSKNFENDHSCVACKKGKQHKASCKTRLVSSISQPLQMLHMDLFGPTFVKSINKKMYFLVITDDFSRCDNGTEFKNSEMNQFCQMKEIKREFSVARTPQQNGVAKKKNRTLIETARSMLADSLLPTTFWAEVVNTACYVQNRVLVTNPHNKTTYELLISRSPNLEFMRPFGFPVNILNTLEHLGKFDGKADEGFLVGYSINSKAFIVFNSRTRKVEENMHSSDVNAGDQPGDGNAGDQPRDVNAGDIQALEDTGIFDGAFDDRDLGTEADTNNLDSSIVVSYILTTRMHKDHPKEQIIRDPNLNTQTRRMINFSEETAMVSFINRQRRTNHKDFQNCLFACFLSQMEPKKMSSMGELTFFLGLQVKKKQDDIFISQDKYVAEILKNFGFSEVNTASTPVETSKPLLKDEDGQEVDVHTYRSMIGSLMFLISLRPDIMFVVCACARHQVSPKVSHLHAVKRIFRYLKGQPKVVLWYPKDFPFELESYTDSDYAGSSLDRKSTTGECQFLGCKLISWQCKKQTVLANSTTEAEYVAASSCCGHATTKVKKVNDKEHIQALVDKTKVIIMEDSIRGDLCFDDAEGTACLLNEENFKGLACMGAKTTAWDEFSSTMASTIICLADNQKFNFLKYIFDMGDTPVETHQTPIVDQPSTSQPQKKQKPKRKHKNETEVSNDETEDKDHVLTPSSDPLPSGEDNSILNELMVFCTSLQEHVLDLQEAKAPQVKEIAALKKKVSKLNKWRKLRSGGLRRLKKFGSVRRVKSSMEKDEITLDDETQGRINDDEIFRVDDLDGEEVVMKTTTGVKDSAAPTTDVTKNEVTMAQALAALKSAKPKDKGKAKMIEPEVPIKRKEQMRIDEELLAERLQAKEREEFSKVEKARLLVKLIEKRKKHFAALRAQEKISKPPTQTQMKSQMYTYLRHIGRYTQSHLKGRSFDEIKKLFGREITKVLIEATPISSRSPTIIDYKIHKEGKKTYFKIIRADGHSQVYQTFEKMFKNFNREDLEILWDIVKDRFKKEKPVDDMDNILFRTLKTMFEHYVKDAIWKYQQGLAKERIIGIKGLQGVIVVQVYVRTAKQKRYPLTPATITEMLNRKLQADHWNEMCYQLLKLMLKQQKKNEVFGYIPLINTKLLIKKLEDSEGEHQV